MKNSNFHKICLKAWRLAAAIDQNAEQYAEELREDMDQLWLELSKEEQEFFPLVQEGFLRYFDLERIKQKKHESTQEADAIPIVDNIEALTVKDLENALSKVRDKESKVVLFADGRFFPCLATQSYNIENQSFVEMGGGWADIDFGSVSIEWEEQTS